MKTEIRKISDTLWRACYTLEGYGETTVPFDTGAEAEAFTRGIEHAMGALESKAFRDAAKARLRDAIIVREPLAP